MAIGTAVMTPGTTGMRRGRGLTDTFHVLMAAGTPMTATGTSLMGAVIPL